MQPFSHAVPLWHLEDRPHPHWLCSAPLAVEQPPTPRDLQPLMDGTDKAKLIRRAFLTGTIVGARVSAGLAILSSAIKTPVAPPCRPLPTYVGIKTGDDEVSRSMSLVDPLPAPASEVETIWLWNSMLEARAFLRGVGLSTKHIELIQEEAYRAHRSRRRHLAHLSLPL